MIGREDTGTPSRPLYVTGALGGFCPPVDGGPTWAARQGTSAGSPLRRFQWYTGTVLDFLPLVNEGDSYGSRRGVFCFTADCPPGVLR
ncbi:hypothetical protein GCM10010094_23610 [Streptomyces flaveus]|uniref:Uncharacterized protein n=1 Tax=Streptomyces flaveus TaxID=66370 RepID=A0A917VCB4_9ACTN|nr:hypothetical protein GCM10010094_23610 [Streptomyces flaveus]